MNSPRSLMEKALRTVVATWHGNHSTEQLERMKAQAGGPTEWIDAILEARAALSAVEALVSQPGEDAGLVPVYVEGQATVRTDPVPCPEFMAPRYVLTTVRIGEWVYRPTDGPAVLEPVL